MIPTAFTRDAVWFGPRKISAATVTREWRCGVCGGRLTERWVDGRGWIVACGRDPGHRNFVHGGALDRRVQQGYEVLDNYRNRKGEFDMPIKDLQRRVPMLKRGGIIRLGHMETTQTGKKYPVADDHFVLKDAPDLVEIYGAEPRRLNILLPFEDIDRVFQAWHQNWRAGGLLCRGDGDVIHYAVSPRDGSVIVRDGQAQANFVDGKQQFKAGDIVGCPGLSHDAYGKCEQCSPNALFIFLIRELPRLAYYQIGTTSKHNIVKLTGQLHFLRNTVGRLTGIPLILELRPEEISTPTPNGKRVRRTKYLLSLEPDPEWVKQLLTTQQAQALPGATEQEPMALPPGPKLHALDEAGESPGFDEEAGIEPPLWEAPVDGEFVDGPEGDDAIEPPAGVTDYDPNGTDTPATPPTPAEQPGPTELPAWVHDLRQQANVGPNSSEPIGAGAEQGLILGLARKLEGDKEANKARIRRFIRILWNCEPEEMTKAMYMITVNLNGDLAARVAELEAA